MQGRNRFIGRGTSSRLTLIIAVVSWSIAVAAPGALAQEDVPPPDDAGGEDLGSVMLLMDSSGSMRGDAGGITKIEAAKEAVSDLGASLPDDTRVGLRVFGGGGDEACESTELLLPVGPVDTGAVDSALERYSPTGTTPIGISLRRAAADLPPGGVRTIVLVSDGKDQCAPPDPCGVAAQLSRRGIDLRIEAIGFRVDSAARRELECIARAGGGIYRDAEDVEELSSELQAISTRAVRRYEPEGTAVTGGASPREAVEVEPGQYVDSVQPDEEKWYALPLVRGETLTAAATLVPPARQISGIGSVLELTIVNPHFEEQISPGSETAANLFIEQGGGIESVGTFGSPVGSSGGSSPEFARSDEYGDAGNYYVRVTFEDTGTKELRDQADGQPFALELLFDVLGRDAATTLPVDAGEAGSADPAPVSGGGVPGVVVALVAAGLAGVGLAVGALLVARRRGA